MDPRIRGGAGGRAEHDCMESRNGAYDALRNYLKIQMRQGGRRPYCLIFWIPAFAGITI